MSIDSNEALDLRVFDETRLKVGKPIVQLEVPLRLILGGP